MAGNSALKRKRQHNDDEKLNHTASVQFAREIKKIKAFEIQKVVKTLAKDPQNSALTASVEHLKSLDVAHLARRAMLSLGLDPPETKKAKASSNAAAGDNFELKALEASLLKHKRLLPLLDTWKAKAAERANKLFREENVILKQARENSKQQSIPSGRRSASTSESMFVGSLSGLGDASGFEKDDIADFLGENHKKNRPGQRARKQKALMEEQRKSGKAPPPSSTVPARGASKYGPSSRGTADSTRPPRPGTKARPPRPTTTQGPDRSRRPHASDTGPSAPPPRLAPSSRRETVEDKTHHPSWAAKQAQKDKEKVDIHAFSGKKVVFDD
ncbi:hypothetical protein H257_06789 [Aphanomyces astaci]|uniref:Bud22 domain-containing protein n=2 Tax=Aphanomyces astaci TaxID=112090 RepID=W4GLI2_APHAT|nr:hypothetical protein H257_06789 [Aphanomyces astaci]ETV80527.1 hypothetical protein H257_06789 [Aphanomyces astaci]|eukprot:XP_009830451.1 hypothetical protein H257_06789 [Aphanomyces astaci]